MSGCATIPPTTKVIDTGCTWTRPIYPSKKDILTEGTARQILSHDQTGAKECGWKPPGKSKK